MAKNTRAQGPPWLTHQQIQQIQQIQPSAQPTAHCEAFKFWLWQEEAQRGRKRAAHFRRKAEKEVAKTQAVKAQKADEGQVPPTRWVQVVYSWYIRGRFRGV